MTTNEIIKTIKAGLSEATTTIAPLAEECVRQYQQRELFLCCSAAFFLVISLGVSLGAFSRFAYLKITKRDAKARDTCIFVGVAMLLVAFPQLLIVLDLYSNYIAPLPGILGR